MSDHTERLARLMQEEITLEAWAVSGVCEHCSDPATFAALWSDRGPVFVCDRHRDEVRRGYLGDHNYDQTGLLWHQLTGAAPPREANPEPSESVQARSIVVSAKLDGLATLARNLSRHVERAALVHDDRFVAAIRETTQEIWAELVVMGVSGAPPGRNTPPDEQWRHAVAWATQSGECKACGAETCRGAAHDEGCPFRSAP